MSKSDLERGIEIGREQVFRLVSSPGPDCINAKRAKKMRQEIRKNQDRTSSKVTDDFAKFVCELPILRRVKLACRILAKRF